MNPSITPVQQFNNVSRKLNQDIVANAKVSGSLTNDEIRITDKPDELRIIINESSIFKKTESVVQRQLLFPLSVN